MAYLKLNLWIILCFQQLFFVHLGDFAYDMDSVSTAIFLFLSYDR